MGVSLRPLPDPEQGPDALRMWVRDAAPRDSDSPYEAMVRLAEAHAMLLEASLDLLVELRGIRDQLNREHDERSQA